GERMGSVVATTVEKDIQTYTALSERNRETFDVIELPYGFYNADFSIATGYRVNPETKEIEFTYPTGEETPEVIEYEATLSEKVAAFESENAAILLSTAFQEMKITSLEEENANLLLSNALQEAKLSTLEE
ncbi:hypothetical protein R2R70_19090, partial [Cobetia sp. SIMBA_158]|uniref:hypothetical protein n=1 Tax=Cobetia sp. SIMBA_158 TaxID=3081617 RepID=UPI00397FF8AD